MSIMKFEKLTISNFGPFKDVEEILFSDNGVVLVWGDNGRGKTSVLNAFKFLFSGKIRDREGRDDNYLSFINIEGKAEGNYSFSISLTLTDGDDNYEITRVVEPRVSGIEPKDSSDLLMSLFVNKNSQIQSPDSAHKIVSYLMPEDISRFFFFDGEFLEEYVELQNDKRGEGAKIKRQIERILGLPVLELGASDTKNVSKIYDDLAVKAAQDDENSSSYANQITRLDSLIVQHQKIIEEKQHDLNDALDLKRLYEEKMNEEAKYREALQELEKIKAVIKTKQSFLEENEIEAHDLLSNAWKWMLQDPIRKTINDLQEQNRELIKKEELSHENDIIINYLQTAIVDDKCPVCEHDLTSAERTILLNKLSDFKTNHSGLSDLEKKILRNDRNRIEDLQNISLGENQLGKLKDLLQKIYDYRVEITSLEENELKEAKENVETYSIEGSDPKKTAHNYGQVETKINLLKEAIQTEEDAKHKKIEIQDDLRKKIEEVSDNTDVKLANEQAKYVKAIADIFDAAIDVYRNKLRKDVEKDATYLFNQMSNESEYSGLEINDNYGLSILLKDGRKVPNASAGWQHIVAFALIGALHKNAPLAGPAIMDSPFGRISSTNKKDMVKALPKISDQVLLLALPGEIDAEESRSVLGGRLSKELLIQRRNAVYSKIIRGI